MLNSIISDNNYKIASMEILDVIKTDPNITQKNIDATIRKICKKYSLDRMREEWGGDSSDLNENGIPDECDIADGTSEDADGNGIPENS